MLLSTTPERAPGGLCWEDLGLRDAAQGRQRLLGHSHSLFCAQAIPGNTRSRAPGAMVMGLWLSSRETRLCPGGQAAASVPLCWPSHALEAFPSVSAELQGPAGGDHSSSFLPRAVLLPFLWQFCPGAGGGIPLSVWFLQSAPAKAVCALCHLPSCAATSSI